MTDHWLDDPSPYLERDAPRCRPHPTELETNCRLCRSEAIANHDREPKNLPPAEYRNRGRRRPEIALAPVIPIDSRRKP